MSDTMAAQLVTDALMMAIWRRGKPDALLHHSDQGSRGGLNRSSQHGVCRSARGTRQAPRRVSSGRVFCGGGRWGWLRRQRSHRGGGR